jgi:hypothetical protein
LKSNIQATATGNLKFKNGKKLRKKANNNYQKPIATKPITKPNPSLPNPSDYTPQPSTEQQIHGFFSRAKPMRNPQPPKCARSMGA